VGYWDDARDPKCRDCALHQTAGRVGYCTGTGPARCNILFLGEAPGAEEERRGRPFVGAAGKLLLDLLEEAEWELPYAITNTTWCRPPSNRKPTKREILACSARHMWPAIEQVRPRMIVCLGNTAFSTMKDQFSGVSVKDFRRKTFTIERQFREKRSSWRKRRREVVVTGTYHPAAIFRMPALRQVVIDDLRWIQKIYLGKGDEGIEDPKTRKYVLQAEGEEAEPYKVGKRFSIDLETTTFNPWAKDARILSVAVSSTPLQAAAYEFGNGRACRRAVSKVSSERHTKIGHNLKFDLLWLAKEGWKVRGPVWDTLVAWHLISEDYPDKSLEHLAARFTPMGHYADGMKQKRGTFTEVTKELLQYNAMDADATYRLRKLFRFQLKAQRLERPFKLMMETLRTLVDVELDGILVDRDEVDILSRRFKKERRAITAKLYEVAGEINLASSRQVATVLYENMGIKCHTFTPQKQPSVSTPALEKILRQKKVDGDRKEFIENYLKYRALHKLETAFLTPLREKHIGWDGRVHPIYSLTGTVTGRLSCRNPNLQQVPKNVKSVFVSRFPSGKIVQADFSQMELRILAMTSGEERMLEVFEKDGDIHRTTAAAIFNIPEENVEKEQRYLAKTINFGILYGMSAGRLSGETGMEFETAREFLSAYWSQYPKVRAWTRKIRQEVLLTGRTRSLFGRVRHLEVTDPQSEEGSHALRQAVNFPIQSDAAAVTLVCMNDLWNWLREGKMESRIIATVHDSIVLDVHPEEFSEVLTAVQELCENPRTSRFGVKITVPMKVDIGYGPNWGELTEWKKED